LNTSIPASSYGEPAVAYYRYSSHSQTEQSIEGQQTAARAYAAAHGYNLVHEYVDRAMTGRNDDREEFQKMLSDVAKHQFKVIILWKVDRFGRNREEITFNKYHCKKNGVRVEYVAENVPQSPEGVILESVLEGMAEYYSLQLSQNIRRGQRESARKAQSTGGNRPLGYLTDPETKKFVVDPATAPTVKTVFAMYAEGYTIAEIITHLNEQGLRTLRGKPFTKNSLRTMLQNEKYVGVYTYKDEVRIEGGVPALVDQDTFDKVQKLLQVNQRAPAHKWSRADYLLTDKLFCGHCGSNMVGESGTSKTGAKYNYYLCTKRKRERACPKKAVRQEWIEKLVLDATVGLLQDDDLLEFIAENTWQFYLAQDEKQARVDSYTAQLATINKSIENLVRAVEAGMFTDILKQRMDALDDEKRALEAALAAEELSHTIRLTKEHILFFLQQFRDRDYQDREEQRRLVEVFVNSVFVYDDEITITYNYGGDSRTLTLREVGPMAAGGEFDGCAPCSTTNEADGLHRLLHCLFSGQGYRRNVALPLVSYALLGQVAEKTLGTPVKV
jgi:DNA invertase Pin-like site-specific DNA recombinase